MIDIVNIHRQSDDAFKLTIFHNVAIKSFNVSDTAIEINYIHRKGELDCVENSVDSETFLWDYDKKSLVDPCDRYTGIFVDNIWYPRADYSLEEYLSIVQPLLNKEITETELAAI